MIDDSEDFWFQIAFFLLWAAWTMIFMLTGWAEEWVGAVGAGLIMTFVTALPVIVPIAVLISLVITLYEEFRA